MPIYEYRCQSCDKVLEVLVRSGKEPEQCAERCLSKEHPEAGRGELTRKISRAGIIFKGSGFYVTDSRKQSSGASSSSSSSKDSSSGNKDGSSGSDSKKTEGSASPGSASSTSSSSSSNS